MFEVSFRILKNDNEKTSSNVFLLTNAPIGAWKCNSPPILDGGPTSDRDRPIKQQADRRTVVGSSCGYTFNNIGKSIMFVKQIIVIEYILLVCIRCL